MNTANEKEGAQLPEEIRIHRTTRSIVVFAVGMTVALVVSSGALAHPDGTHDNKTFEITFTCEGFGAFVPVDAETARAEGDVPANFRFQERTEGTAEALVGGFDCGESTADGKVTGPYDYSLVSITLDPPHGGGYDIWQFMDFEEQHNGINALGGWSRLLDDISVDVTRIGGTPVSGHADVPWPQSPYTIDAVMPGTAPLPPIESPSNHWFSGPHGDVHASHDSIAHSVVGALISVDTTPGTPLARVLGGDVTDVPGIYLEFSGQAIFQAEQL